MKKIETAILALVAVLMASIQALYAQADSADVPNSDKAASNYFWIIAVTIIVIGLVAAAIYRARHRKDKTGNLTGDINNPASGI